MGTPDKWDGGNINIFNGLRQQEAIKAIFHKVQSIYGESFATN